MEKMRNTTMCHRISDNVAQTGTGFSQVYLKYNCHAYVFFVIKKNELKFLYIEDGGNNGRLNSCSNLAVK